MDLSQKTAVTKLLQASSRGDEEALNALFPVVYDELRRMARKVRRGRASETICTTALVHDAYLKLARSDGVAWQDRLHFFRVAARVMRQVLVDAARHRMAEKRGGGQLAVTFNEEVHAAAVPADQFLALDEALQQLEALDARQAQVVECRFFAGLTVEETAAVLSVSTPTVKRDWRAARAFLARHLNAARETG